MPDATGDDSGLEQARVNSFLVYRHLELLGRGEGGMFETGLGFNKNVHTCVFTTNAEGLWGLGCKGELATLTVLMTAVPVSP